GGASRASGSSPGAGDGGRRGEPPRSDNGADPGNGQHAETGKQTRDPADRSANPGSSSPPSRVSSDCAGRLKTRCRTDILGTDSSQTHRWREPDSNHRYRSYERVSRLLSNEDAGPISWRGH